MLLAFLIVLAVVAIIALFVWDVTDNAYTWGEYRIGFPPDDNRQP